MKQHCNYTWLEITSYVLYNDSSERQTMKSLKLYIQTQRYIKRSSLKKCKYYYIVPISNIYLLFFSIFNSISYTQMQLYRFRIKVFKSNLTLKKSYQEMIFDSTGFRGNDFSIEKWNLKFASCLDANIDWLYIPPRWRNFPY